MAAAFCIRLLDPGAAGGDPGAAGCQQGAQPWQRLLAGRTACAIPSSPGDGAGGLRSSLGLPEKVFRAGGSAIQLLQSLETLEPS